MAAKTPNVTRVRIAREELDKMSKEQLQKCWCLMEQYVDLLENKLQSNSEHTELMSLRESEEKLKQQQIDASRRENILVMRLTTKEHEMQEFAGQIQELKQAQVPTIAQLRSSMLDPAVNLLFEKMKKEVDTLKARLREMQDEFNAWKFTPDSNTGKRLMAKCRLLYQENEELGKIISSGRMAKLEGDLALQKSFSEEMKKSQAELDEFLLELDEDVEGMQSTIYYLQQQLREAKEQIAQLQKDKLELSGISNGLSPISHPVNVPDTKRKSPLPQIRTENGQPTSNPQSHDAPAPFKTEINGTSSSEIKSEVFSEEEELLSPVKDCLDPNTGEKPHLRNSKSPMSKEAASSILGAIAQSVIVENKSSINHDKQIPLVERTNLIVDATESSDSIQQKRTSEQMLDDTKPAENDASDMPKDSSVQLTQKPNKRTSDVGRGRKRTRPRTPESIKEDSLPVRKRTRRREAEMLAAADAMEEKRTPVEIDTDTEVQVAETLASWAATKQERTEVKTELEDSTLGNGELSRMDEDK